MNPYVKTVFFTMAAFLLAACQGGVGSPMKSSDRSQYAEEQPRESYLNSPAYINVQLGIEYMKTKEFGLALSKLKKALLYNPDLAVAHTTIAVLYEEIGEKTLAEQHYKRSISLDANDPRLRNNYGQFLCRHDNERDGIKQFELAANNPLYATPYIPLVNAGSCAMRINELAQAETYFRRALEEYPTLPLALRYMTRISVKQQNYLQGRAYLQRYKAVGKHTAETLWAGYQIEKNLGDKDAAANYAVRLKSRFPHAAQTGLLLEEISGR